jgi:hypothetical protein
MGFPSVDSLHYRLRKIPLLRESEMFNRGFSPRRDGEDTESRIQGWYKNLRMQQYAWSDGFGATVGIEWYRKFGTYLDVQVKSLTQFHHGTSRKSFPDFRAYLYPLAMLRLLFKDLTGLDAPFGLDPFTATIARLDIAQNLVFERKSDALGFIERLSNRRVPSLKFTRPKDLPGAFRDDNIANGTGIYYLNNEQCFAVYLKHAVDPSARNIVRLESRLLSTSRLLTKVEKLNRLYNLNLRPVAEHLFHPDILQLLWWEKARYLVGGAEPVSVTEPHG